MIWVLLFFFLCICWHPLITLPIWGMCFMIVAMTLKEIFLKTRYKEELKHTGDKTPIEGKAWRLASFIASTIVTPTVLFFLLRGGENELAGSLIMSVILGVPIGALIGWITGKMFS